jgi:hypothetical protein
MDTGPVVEAPANGPVALCWPGLTRPILASPLSEEEWARLDEATPLQPVALGDLDDLVVAASGVAPDDRARAPRACRVLVRAFGSHGKVFSDALPRALEWLEATLTAPDGMGPGVVAYAHLESLAGYNLTPRPLPVVAMTAAAEIATVDDRSALASLFARRGADGRAALEVLTLRQASGAHGASPEALTDELRALFAAYYRGAIPPEVAESMAARWHSLFRAAPELARSKRLTDYVIEDTTPCALLLGRIDGPPSAALIALVHDIFSLAFDDRDGESAFSSAVRARWHWLCETLEAAPALLRGPETRFISKQMVRIARAAIAVQLVPVDAPFTPSVAAQIADDWHRLYRFAPESATRFVDDLARDGSPHAILLERLSAEAPCAALGRLVCELAETIAESAECMPDRTRFAPFIEAARRNAAALRRLADTTREAGETPVAARMESAFAELGV